MSLLNTLVSLAAVEFNIGLQLFPPIEGTTLYFLQEDGGTVNYKLTANTPGLTTGWQFTTNQYQQTKEFQVASLTLGDVIAKSTHVAIGTHVYSIERGSLDPPNADYPYYSFEVQKSGESFVAP